MFGFIKLVIAFLVSFIIYNHAVNYIERKENEKKNHVCELGNNNCKLCPRKKKSLFESPKGKEIVFYLKEGQVLEDNQVLFNTPEGKKLYLERLTWLTELCDAYAEKLKNPKNNP